MGQASSPLGPRPSELNMARVGYVMSLRGYRRGCSHEPDSCNLSARFRVRDARDSGALYVSVFD
jgi:hypothetical protein